MRLLTYIACLCLCCHGAPVVVSEVHGNPERLPDSQGEYLELFHADSLPYSSDSLVLVLDAEDTLRLPSDWEDYQIRLICKDSSAMAAHGFSCHREWASLSLTNSRELSITVADSSQVLVFTIPSPLPGVSWENLLESPSWNRFVEASHSQTVYTDKGSPGRFSSQADFVFSRDVALTGVSVDWDSARPPSFTLQTTQRGRHHLDGASLKVSVDRDWDGISDLTLDSLTVDLPPSSGTLPFRPTTAFEGFYHFQLEGDPNPGNHSAMVSLFSDVPLKLSEVCPDPPEGAPEWIEVRNTSGRALSLDHITLNGNALEIPDETGGMQIHTKNQKGTPSHNDFLAPYSYAVLTQNSENFLTAYPGYGGKLREVTKWSTLKNTGDTVRVAWGGQFPLDSMSYGSLSGVADESCWERSEPHGQWVAVAPKGTTAGNPGDSTSQAPGLQWEVTPKLINIEKAGSAIRITIKAPLNLQYNLRVFSLNGEEVAGLCAPCQGSRPLTWNGRFEGGKALPLGPYILALKPEGRPVRKKTIVLARPL